MTPNRSSSDLSTPGFGRGDLWVRRVSIAAVAALALGLVSLGVALYGPNPGPPPAPPTLTLQETYR